MKPSVFNPNDKAAIVARLNALTPQSQRLWGTMSVSQMLNHLQRPIQHGLGEISSKKAAPSWVGWLAKNIFLGGINFPKNTVTMKEFKVRTDDYNFETEKQAVLNYLQKAQDHVNTAQLKAHPLFGNLSADEWGQLTYVHLDHHLRQFGV